MRATYWALLIAVAFASTGCGWVKGLRRDLEDDEPAYTSTEELEFYRDPVNRFAPPPPANVRDSRIAEIAGTPLDLSGVRAKNLRVRAEHFAAEAEKNENSLWHDDGQTNFLFSRNRTKAPGDLITVQIDERLRADMVNSVRTLLPPEYRDAEIRVPGLTKEKAAADTRAPAGAPTQAAAATGTEDLLTAEVLERYPNGNLRIRGIKRVPFKRQVRNIEVVAIVRGQDIDERDVVDSSKFFDHKVELYR